MSKKMTTSLVLVNLATPPASPVEGELYYDTDDDKVYLYTGAGWVTTTGSGTVVPAASVRRSAGDVSTSSTSYVDVTGMSASIAAATGDIIQIGVSGRWTNASVTKRLDAMTTTGSNYCSGDGSGGIGVAGWSGFSGVSSAIGGIIQYTVVAGDISAGLVAIKLRMKMSAATSGTIEASSPILEMNLANLKH